MRREWREEEEREEKGKGRRESPILLGILDTQQQQQIETH